MQRALVPQAFIGEFDRACDEVRTAVDRVDGNSGETVEEDIGRMRQKLLLLLAENQGQESEHAVALQGEIEQIRAMNQECRFSALIEMLEGIKTQMVFLHATRIFEPTNFENIDSAESLVCIAARSTVHELIDIAYDRSDNTEIVTRFQSAMEAVKSSLENEKLQESIASMIHRATAILAREQRVGSESL